jgi:hypothetical protein
MVNPFLHTAPPAYKAFTLFPNNEYVAFSKEPLYKKRYLAMESSPMKKEKTTCCTKTTKSSPREGLPNA